ncbi:hypothetical protein PQX77_001108 [Marasmius sp. AFHP31]|nr:hypothetical protein PQX77_001108 [Marasmius sp. AFHP31]
MVETAVIVGIAVPFTMVAVMIILGTAYYLRKKRRIQKAPVSSNASVHKFIKGGSSGGKGHSSEWSEDETDSDRLVRGKSEV